MNRGAFDNLDTGDVIQSAKGEGWIVTQNYGTLGVLVVRAQLIHNPPEWKLIQKARQAQEEALSVVETAAQQIVYTHRNDPDVEVTRTGATVTFTEKQSSPEY